METEKRTSPNSSADEEGDREELSHHSEEEDSARRSYGCTFCKRGFTNAQALGGHMNIHRKDRVKGKGHLHHQNQAPVSSLNNGKRTPSDADNSRNNSDHVGGEGSYLMNPYEITSQAQRGITDYNKFFQIPVTNPSSPRHKRNFMESDFTVRSSQSLGRNDRVFLDDGLSLRIGLSASSDWKESNVSRKKREIDLELRLGRDP